MPQRAFGIFKICTTIQYRSRLPLHSMPSCCVRRKSASWHRIEIIKAFAFIKVKDSLPKSWPVTCPSSSPLHLANALASSFTWVTAPWWRPPEVFTANGRKPGLHINNLLQSLSIFSSQPCQEHLLPSPQPRPHWWNREDWSQSH